jgi:23S rRNA pseudouridine1911/1915/1917 synthase
MELEKSFTTEKYEVLHLVEEEHDGIRLDQFLMNYLVSFSRQNIKKKIASGDVTILGRPHPHKPSAKVYAGEKVRIITLRGNLEDEYWRGEKLELELDPTIIKEDDDLLVVAKPPYMTTHPTGKHLFNCATVYFETKYGHTIHSIHRLDRETSGVQLLGKNPTAAQKFTDYFEKDEVSKCYFLMAEKEKTIDFPISAKERLGTKDDFIPRLFNHCFAERSTEGKHAQTDFFEIFQNDKYILAIAKPKTGRQHQIRSHAAHHGFPLIGDKLYNGDPSIFMRFKDGDATEEDHDRMDLHRHALHALALKIPKYDLFKAPLPQDFIDWLEKRVPELKREEIELKIDGILKEIF